MEFKTADMGDFDIAFDFFEKLWTSITYDKDEMRKVYERTIADPNSFVFFVIDNGDYKGLCHGNYYDTFWMCGLTCYVSSLITKESERGKGYGTRLLDHAKELAMKKGCKALTLMSAFQRTDAHQFYENYGFEKGCYGFEYIL